MPRRKRKCLPDHAPYLPSSGVDWVWCYANERVGRGLKRSLRRDGPEVHRAIPLVRALQANGLDSYPIIALRRKDPALVAAYELKIHGGQRTLLELQCRVLAAQSYAIIAVAMDLDDQVVEAYCSLFFRVREHLGARQYILYRVIGINLAAAPLDHQFVMLAAHLHGPEAVDPLLDWYDHRSEMHDLTTELGRMREKFEQLFLFQTLPNDEASQKAMLRWLTVHSKVERMLVPERTVHQVIGENVSLMLTEISSDSKELPPHDDSSENRTRHRTAHQSNQINQLFQSATVS